MVDLPAESPREHDRLPLAKGVEIVRRHGATIAVAAAAGLGLGLLYLLVAPSQYTAVAQLLIDTRRSHSFAAAPEVQIDPVVIESQIETIKSEKIAAGVIDKLGLQDDPEFVARGLIDRILVGLGHDQSEPSATPAIKQQEAVNHFKRALSVAEIGRTYVAEIRFTSSNPALAATIANAVANSYIDDQLETSSSNTSRAAAWMAQRIDELRMQASSAARALELYKSKSGISAAGDPISDADVQARLRALQAMADSSKRSYETFQNLNRYSETTQERSFPVTDARVLSPALTPVTRTSPRTGVTLLLSLLAGCGVGLVIAFRRDHLDRSIRTGQQLESELGVKCLGLLPLLRGRKLAPNWRRWMRERSRRLLRFRYPPQKGIAALFGRDSAFPRAWETLVGVRVAIDGCGRAQQCQVIGITSPYDDEGKTTLAINLADSMAATGKRVLLLDADLRNSSLTQLLAPGCVHGLSEALAGSLDLGALQPCPEFDFHLLPGTAGKDGQCPPEVLSSAAMRDVLGQARTTYDCVFVDLPAALDHVDVGAIASCLDGFLVVVEWGRTRIDDLEQVLTSSSALSERVMGVVINKVRASSVRPNRARGARARWI